MRLTEQLEQRFKKEPFYTYLVAHEDLLRAALSYCSVNSVDYQCLSGLLQLTMQEIENYRETMGFPLSKTAPLTPSAN